jgi:hypothetical protein
MAYYNVYDDGFLAYNGPFDDLNGPIDSIFSNSVDDSIVIAPPIYHPVDAMILDAPDLLDPYRNYTSEIVYLWNNFDDVKRGYVIDRFGNFHPRDEVYWDFERNYDWYDLFGFWEYDSSYNYFDNRYILTNEGRVNLLSLILYMREIAGKNLAELAKKQCCSKEKAIADAIWDKVGEKNFNKSSYSLSIDDYTKIKKNVKKKFSEPTNKEIDNMYYFMQKCYSARKKSGFQISKFLDKVAEKGITGMDPSTYKKYLLFKKKYLEKKTLKKL